MMSNLRVSGAETGSVNGLAGAGASGTGYGRSNYRGV